MKANLYRQQELIELQCREDTIGRFESDLTNKVQTGEESATYYGSPLMKRAIEPFVELIQRELDAALIGKVGKRQIAMEHISTMPVATVAFIATKTIIDRITGKRTLQDCAVTIGTDLDDERLRIAFEAEHPFLFKKITKEASDNRKRRQQNMKGAYNRYSQKWSGWSKSDKLHIGMKLIELFIDATGFVRVDTRWATKNKSEKILVATQSVCEFVEKNRGLASVLNPIRLPMVVPPQKWTCSNDGGYLTHHVKPLSFVKTDNRNYLEELDGMRDQMQDVFDAVNTTQETPYAINPFTFVAFEILFESGLSVAGLPAREDLPTPPCPIQKNQDTKNLSDADKERFKKWKSKARAVYEENIRTASRRLSVAITHNIGKQFVKYDRIYFPHNLDWRGRMYPTPMFLNPQGNSLAKGLLQFADGKPLGSEEAAGEFLIHGANCFGFDKGSMQERVDWVAENHDAILRCAMSPIDNLWWAKEADDPWCFLAWCHEYAGYVEHGYDHVSYLPIAKDGSCSGLQHFSAALRDPVGGSATNLVPSDTPADIYQTVIDRTIETVKADLGGEKSHLAQMWLSYGMTRKTAKRCTMTRVYGSTLYSAKDFVLEYIVETDEKRKAEDPNYTSILAGHEFEASVYLARHIWDSINNTVVAAKVAMDWLQDIASILAKENIPIWWNTLDGFPVMQSYADFRGRRVKTKLGDTLVYLTLREELQNKLNSRNQRNGISPNWVHSNDGCHLRMTVNLAKANGVTHFAMVHDSFACHASDVPMLGACIREAFVDLYVNNDPLASFLSEVQELTQDDLPPLPEKGTLDVEQVRDSEFFFS